MCIKVRTFKPTVGIEPMEKIKKKLTHFTVSN